MDRHTPGPWAYWPKNISDLANIAFDMETNGRDEYAENALLPEVGVDADGSVSDGGVIATLASIDRNKPLETIANARLISTAPELLEHLKAFVLNVGVMNDEHFAGAKERLVNDSKAVIAKAEGGHV